jgi:hypothetical protein
MRIFDYRFLKEFLPIGATCPARFIRDLMAVIFGETQKSPSFSLILPFSVAFSQNLFLFGYLMPDAVTIDDD